MSMDLFKEETSYTTSGVTVAWWEDEV